MYSLRYLDKFHRFGRLLFLLLLEVSACLSLLPALLGIVLAFLRLLIIPRLFLREVVNPCRSLLHLLLSLYDEILVIGHEVSGLQLAMFCILLVHVSHEVPLL